MTGFHLCSENKKHLGMGTKFHLKGPDMRNNLAAGSSRDNVEICVSVFFMMA